MFLITKKTPKPKPKTEFSLSYFYPFLILRIFMLYLCYDLPNKVAKGDFMFEFEEFWTNQELFLELTVFDMA